MVGGLLVSKVSLEPRKTAQCYLIIGGLIALLCYVYWRRMTALFALLEALVALFLVTVPIFICLTSR